MSMSCVSVSNRGGTVDRGPVKKSNVVLVLAVGGGGVFPGDLGGSRGRGGRGFWREKWVGGLQGPRSVDSVTQAYPCSQERFIVAPLPVLQISLNLYIKLCTLLLAMAGDLLQIKSAH